MQEEKKSRGIFLPCFGKRGYYFAAYNFAFSIKKHNPDIKIALFHDGQIEKELCYGYMPGVFDILIRIPDEILWHGGKIDPGFIKIAAPEFHPFNLTLQMDVECQALQDLNIIFDELEADGGYFYTQIIGSHKIEQGREIPSMVWAWADDIWDHFNLPSDAILPSSNSSFQFWKKGPEADAFHQQVKKNYDYPIPIDKLRYAWGGTQPDELYLNVAMAQKGITGKTPREFLWMGNSTTDVRQAEIEAKFPIMCFFGNRRQTRPFFINWYETNLHRWHSEKGLPHHLKYHLIQADKHANNARIIKKPAEYQESIITEMKHDERAFLYLPFFLPEEKERREEIMHALKMNIACEEIEKIILISEQDLDIALPEKCEIIKLDHRTMYSDCIREANQRARPNLISIIANADIYFDNRNIRLLKELNYSESAFALSRWDIDPQGRAKHFNYEWSQDSWIFRGKIPAMNCDFNFGVPACDGRFAMEMKKNFRRIGNPSFSIKSFHVHHSAVHSYSEADRLPGDTLPLFSETADAYRKKSMLMIQKGKVGDVLICLPIARKLSEEYLIDWLCPKQYHPLFDYVGYCRPIEEKKKNYDRILDLSFGQGGAPEAWWHREKSRFKSFIEAKYELAGIPVEERANLYYHPNHAKEEALYGKIIELTGGRNYALIHDESDYGTRPNINLPDDLYTIYFKKMPGTDYTIFDWRKVVEHASEIHCIDSSLCNFVAVLPLQKSIKKFYYKTDRCPAQYDETIIDSSWERIYQNQKIEEAI